MTEQHYTIEYADERANELQENIASWADRMTEDGFDMVRYILSGEIDGEMAGMKILIADVRRGYQPGPATLTDDLLSLREEVDDLLAMVEHANSYPPGHLADPVIDLYLAAIGQRIKGIRDRVTQA